MSTELLNWEDAKALTEVRKLFAPKLNDIEFAAFVGLGKASGLNPYLREIWSVKYDSNAPAQIFIGRDGYRKAAQKNPEYDYHQSDAVYENDNFKVSRGEIEHDYNLKNRGILIGAYCAVKRRNASRPIYVYVELKEYDTKQSVWKGKPATMLKKVAEAQALRTAFQEQFGGTYSEEEMEKPSQTSRLNTILEARSNNGNGQTIHMESANKVVSAETGEIIESVDRNINQETDVKNQGGNSVQVNDEQLLVINDLMREKKFNHDRKLKALEYFKVNTFEALSSEQAEVFTEQLQKI